MTTNQRQVRSGEKTKISRNFSSIFEKRRKTTDPAQDYKHIYIAQLVLKLIENEEIEDFSLSSNNEKFCDFDDIVVEIKYHTRGIQIYAFQLKYFDSRKVSTIAGLTGDNGNFEKYVKNVKSNVKLILFTNSTFNGQKFKFGETAVKVDNSLPDPLLSTWEAGQCYQLKIENAADCLLYANQADVTTIEVDTLEAFTKMFNCDESVFTEYVYFIIGWNLTEGTTQKLSKRCIKRAIAIRVLSPFIKPLSFSSSPVDENTKLLRDVMSKFRITIFDKRNYKSVKSIWKDVKNEIDLKEVNDVRKQYQVKLNHVDNLEDFGGGESNVILWLMGQCPLVLDGRTDLNPALKMCEDDNFVVLSPKFSIESSSQFQDLSGLENQPQLYQNFMNRFVYSLPCAGTVTLSEMNLDRGEIKKITTDELVLMTNKYIPKSDQDEILPPCYIFRSLSKVLIDSKFLNQVSKNNLILISSIEDLDSFKCRFDYVEFVKVEDFSNDYDETVIYVSEGEYCQEEFDKLCAKKSRKGDCHQFRYVNDECLEWIRSNSIKKLRKYLLKGEGIGISEMSINESELFDGPSTNSINIICGDPGMGKTTLMKNLKNEARPSVLTILIHVRNHVRYFQKKNVDAEEFVDYIFKKRDMNRRISQILKTNGRIQFIWDGLDEISNENLNIAKKIIKNVSRRGHRQWITSRNNLKILLETEFNVFSKNLMPLDDDQQKSYVGNRLGCYDADLVKICAKIRKNIARFPNHNIIEAPLQLFMLTELLGRDLKTNLDIIDGVFTAADLFEHFVDDKFQIDNQNVDSISAKSAHKSLLSEYEKVAAATYLDQNLVEVSDCDKFLKKIHSGRDPFGLITHVSEELCPEFCHNSFGEYFTASYISQNYTNIFQSNDFLYNERYKNIRFFLDLILSKNSKAHVAVLYKNLELLRECNATELTRQDKVERNALQLALTWRQKYPILKTEKTEKNECIIYCPSAKRRFNDAEFQQIVDFLWKHGCESENSIFFDDAFLLLPFTRLSNEDKRRIREFRTKFFPSVLFYAVQIDHSKIFTLFSNLPFVMTNFRENLLHLAVEHGSVKSLKHILCTPNYTDYLTTKPKLLSKMCSKFGDLLKSLKIDVNVRDGDNRTALHYACDANNLDAIKFLIKSGADLDARDNNNQSPLHRACAPKVIQLLIQNGADVDSRDEYGQTAVHRACRDSSVNALTVLTQNGANLNIVDKTGHAPIHYACLNGSSDILKLLIQNGADVNPPDERGKTALHHVCENEQFGDDLVTFLANSGGKSNLKDKSGRAAIHYACQNGFSEKLKLLIKSGARVNVRDGSNKTALHYSCQDQTIPDDVVELLLRKSAKMNVVDQDGRTPLHYACTNGSVEKVKLLIQNGADVNAQNARGKTILHYACETRSISSTVVKLLISNRVDLDVADKCGRTALHYCCLSGSTKKLKLLIQNGAGVNVADNWNKTPLHYACEKQKLSYDFVKTLIQSEADLDLVDSSDRTAAHYACMTGSLEKLQLLIDNGANVNVRTATCTLLQFACESSCVSPTVTELLIRNVADLNSIDQQGRTPMHHACIGGCSEKVRLLILNRAKVNVKDKGGKTVLHYACMYSSISPDIVADLVESGANVSLADKDGRVAIHYACLSNSLEKVTILLSKGASIEVKDRNYKKPLHYANQDLKNSLNLNSCSNCTIS
jgi:ankyrin repeat protein/Pyruvate/2-oxoacid:ferredoxin oxidoreductase delta subunit